MSPARTPPEKRRFWTWLWWRLFALVGGAVIVGATVGLWFFVPFWVIVAAVVSTRVPGRWRPLRLFWLLLLHLTLESLVLVSLLGLWMGSGFGRVIRRPFFQWCHYDVMHWYLRNLFRESMRVLRLRIVTSGPTPDAFPGDPLIVLSRHAGPGDSFTVVHALMDTYRREPRIGEMDRHARGDELGLSGLQHQRPVDAGTQVEPGGPRRGVGGKHLLQAGIEDLDVERAGVAGDVRHASTRYSPRLRFGSQTRIRLTSFSTSMGLAR